MTKHIDLNGKHYVVYATGNVDVEFQRTEIRHGFPTGITRTIRRGVSGKLADKVRALAA